MKRRDFLRTVGVGAANMVLSGCAESLQHISTEASSGKPNIIFILADDLGYADLGCYGQNKIRTPNLDKLAAQGMKFTQHYSGNPVCAPSRCTLMTAKHTGHAQIRSNKQVGGKEGWQLGSTIGGQWPLEADTVTVAKILKDAGYELKQRHAPKKDYIRFEASRPLELSQIDICEFYIHKQRVYLVLLLDDFSRFLLNFSLLEQCNMEQIEKMVSDAINRYGKMERLISDRGFVFHGWRGINAFEKFLEGMDIYHIHTSPYHPETIGKIEAVNKSIQKELIRQEEFSSIADARGKIRDWIWRYNYHRVHQGLDGLCVPADRFHGWLEEVERGMSKLVENGIDLSLRQINLFNISLNNGKIELTIMGRKFYIQEGKSN